MSDWRTLDPIDAYHPEIRMGLYELWLSAIEFGPTQAERVLIHSYMLEQAHERRFAIAQLGLDYSGFEAEHARRINYLFSTLESNFTRQFIADANRCRAPTDKYVLGLASPEKDVSYPDHFAIERPPESSLKTKPQYPPPDITSRNTQKHVRSSPSVVDVDDTDNSDHNKQLCLEVTRTTRAHIQSRNSRTLRTVRIRKRPIPCTLPENNVKGKVFRWGQGQDQRSEMHWESTQAV